ncbi:MAG: hypothetical protein ACRCSV_04530, partial [Chlamydiales bacterium]
NKIYKNKINKIFKKNFTMTITSRYRRLQKSLHKNYNKNFILQIIDLISGSNTPKNKKKNTTLYSGNYYNLEEIYQDLNKKYFMEKVKVPIIWFGNTSKEARVSRLLGYYDEDENIIKIHRLLDSPTFPPFYFRYVIYHEMLHTVCRPYMRSGRYITHHKSFRKQEKEFQEYALAVEWEKKNIHRFFSDQKRKRVGRAQ